MVQDKTVQAPPGAQNRAKADPQRVPKQVMIPFAKAKEQAYAHFNAGRLQAAAQVCAQLVQARPRDADLHNLMGVILNAQGNAQAAVKALQRAIHLNDSNPQFYSNLGEIERQRGKLQEAQVALRRAISLDPKFAQALNNLGIVHFDLRKFEDAVALYEQAIAANGTYPEAHNNLGNALRALGKQEEALEHYQRALLLRERYPEAYNNLAAILRDRDQVAEAEHAYRKAISMRPNYLEPYNNLAAMMVQEGKEDEALRVLGEALKINARHVPTLVQVARTQLSKGNQVQAEQAARLALKEDAENAEAHVVLAQVLHETDRFPDALASLEEAIKLKPDLGEAHNLYGVCLKSVGRLDDARLAFLKAVELNPQNYGIYANFADLEKFHPEHPQFKALLAAYEEAAEPMSERYMGLHFALGKAYDDLGEYQKAFSHFKIGTTLKRAKLDYVEAETFGFFDMIEQTFTPEFFQKMPFKGHPSEEPVFIVGMPRSGSTLVEQILSSHPDTFGAGETKEFSRQLGALRSRFPALPKYPAIAEKMNIAQYQIVSDGYINAQRKISGGAARITDKLLTNYFFVGMLHVMFPKAKFIHTKRNPVDTCLSAFTKLFKDDMPHSYDLGELGRYYLKYQHLMDHWEKVLPPGVLKTVVYEEVVDKLEETARDIVDFVGLPWNEACLSFHESSRPVKTASVVQVRKPIYTTSVERWRRYGDDLLPLIEALGYKPPQAA